MPTTHIGHVIIFPRFGNIVHLFTDLILRKRQPLTLTKVFAKIGKLIVPVPENKPFSVEGIHIHRMTARVYLVDIAYSEEDNSLKNGWLGLTRTIYIQDWFGALFPPSSRSILFSWYINEQTLLNPLFSIGWYCWQHRLWLPRHIYLTQKYIIVSIVKKLFLNIRNFNEVICMCIDFVSILSWGLSSFMSEQ